MAERQFFMVNMRFWKLIAKQLGFSHRQGGVRMFHAGVKILMCGCQKYAVPNGERQKKKKNTVQSVV